MKKNNLKTLTSNFFLLVATAFVALLFCEVLLTALVPKKHHVWPPYVKEEFIPKEGALPGVEGRKRFSINSEGIRGDEFSEEFNYHILAVGGSTTICLFLDNEEAWPYLTQTLLKEIGRSTWVGNVGKSGGLLADHLEDAQKLMESYPFLDALVVMVGINDLFDVLSYTLEGDRPKKKTYPFYTQTMIWKTARKIKENLVKKKTEKLLFQDQTGDSYIKWRENRMEAEKEDNLPDLTASLAEYERNLNRLLDLSTQENVRVILMTQPTMWKVSMPPEEEKLLWFGWGGTHQAKSKKYYSVRALSNPGGYPLFRLPFGFRAT